MNRAIHIILSLSFLVLFSCSEKKQTTNIQANPSEKEDSFIDTSQLSLKDQTESVDSLKDNISTTIDSFSTTSRPVTFKKAEVDSTQAEKPKPKPIKPAATASRKSPPKMTFENETHYFGEVEQGESFLHKFKFMNTGGTPLVVKKVDATCGCTQPTYPFLPIEPGDTGFIEVQYNSTGKLGNQRPMLTITSNAKPAITKLYLEGLVTAPLANDTVR